MKTLVTGATGLVGSAVVRELLRSGHEVKVLVRPGSNRLNLKGLELEEAVGDVTDYNSVLVALKGCSRVYHVAALYTIGDPTEAYYRVNVGGTRNVLKACIEAGIEKVVYTSTVGAVGSARDGRLADEDTVWDLGDLNIPYVTTKFIAEFEAYRAYAKGLPVVIVCPTGPMGERDVKPTPTGRLIVDFLNGKMPLYPQMYFNVIDVDDVALGHRLAMEKGRPGERYILGNKNIALSDLLRTVAELAGVPGPKMAIPYPAALVFSFLAELLLAHILRRSTMFTVGSARFLRRKMHASNRKAVEELGLTLTPYEEVLKKAIRWFHSNGYIKRPIRVP